jgi:hypothetical protein
MKAFSIGVLAVVGATWACTPSIRHDIRLLLPDGYRGLVLLVVKESMADKESAMAGRTITIPDGGVAYIHSSKVFEGEFTINGEYKSGGVIPSDYTVDGASIAVRGGSLTGLDLQSEHVTVYVFCIGTEEECESYTLDDAERKVREVQ